MTIIVIFVQNPKPPPAVFLRKDDYISYSSRSGKRTCGKDTFDERHELV